METVKTILQVISKIAATPYALLTSVIVITAWVFIAWRIKRNLNLGRYLATIPPEDRIQLVQVEMNTIIPAQISPEDWLKVQRIWYGFWALVMLGVAMVIVVLIYELGLDAPPADPMNLWSIF